jgi:hypothetical protein
MPNKTNEEKRLYIIYDGRAMFGDTGDDRVVYSYAKKGKKLVDQMFEFVLSPTERKGNR